MLWWSGAKGSTTDFLTLMGGSIHDLAGKIDNRQLVGWRPEVSVIAAEKRFKWFMALLKSNDRPLGQVEELVKKEYQK